MEVEALLIAFVLLCSCIGNVVLGRERERERGRERTQKETIGASLSTERIRRRRVIQLLVATADANGRDPFRRVDDSQ